MTRLLGRAFLLACLALSAGSVLADDRTYVFTINRQSGSLLGSSSTGSLSFDESLAMANNQYVGPDVLSAFSLTIGSTFYGLASVSTGLLWFDAHGDLNTPETTTSGFFDGMALSVALGRCWAGMAARIPGFQPVPERDVALVGVRDMDPGERAFLGRGGVRAIAVDDLRQDIPRFLETVERQVSTAYVHLDLDVLDPSVGRVNAYVAPDGLREDDVIWTVRQVVSRVPLGALAITAYDPAYDEDGRVLQAALRIADGSLE